jgi:hypothetical protein
MSRALTRALLVVGLSGGAALGMAGTANAGCYGTDNTVGVCDRNVVVYEDCVHTGNGCTDVIVTAPACIYGWIGDTGYYTTTFC